MKSISGVYQVNINGEYFNTKPRGLFREKKFLPIAGDIVEFEVQNISKGYIHQVFERENELRRPPVGSIDILIIVVSAVEPDFSTRLLGRFLVIAYSCQLNVRILMTKEDKTPIEKQSEISESSKVYENVDYEIESIGGDDDQKKIAKAWSARLIILSDQSGVGKPTFSNHYCPEPDLETDDMPELLSRGEHTIEHVELFERQSGYTADTPGFSTLDFDRIDEDKIKGHFLGLNRYDEVCKFRNCNRIKEPSCNVKH